MASVLKVDKLDHQSGTALEIGTSGDTVTVPSGVGLTLTDSTLLLPTTITSTTEVKTNKISPATGAAFALGDSGDTFTVPSGATIVNSGTATGFGGGKLLQVVVGTTTTDTAMTSTTFADTTLTADITPTSTDNDVLVIVNQYILVKRTTASTIGAGLKLIRDTTEIYYPAGVGSGGRNFQLNATGTTELGLQMVYSFSYLDSPSATSATTYKTQQAVAEDDNQTSRCQYNDAISTIILMEIDGS